MTIQFKKISDPTKDASGNILVTVLYWDDATPLKTYTEVFKAFDASDDTIGAWVIKRYMVQTAAEAALVDLAATKNVQTVAGAVVSLADLTALQAAQKAFARASRRALVLTYNDQAATDALTALEAAEDAVNGK